MKSKACLPWVAVAALLFLAGGCLELTGQRITMRYDQEADRLAFLLQYDGIHNSEKSNTSQEDAEQKLRQFVANGDAMLFDWFGHIQPVEIRQELQSDPPARLKEFGDRFLASFDQVVLGHYRDPDGRLGVAQLVTLEHATELVAAGNAAISEALLAAPAPDPAWKLTMLRWRDLAAHGHAWLSIEGHSLVWKCVVDQGEWARGKLQFLAEISKSWQEKTEGGTPENFGHRLLAAAPLSLMQSGDEVTVRLGDVKAPTTLRIQWRDTYRPNVEQVVQEIVPGDLDQRLAACLLGDREPDSSLAELIEWGPSEERVRAVLGRARSADDRQSERALAWLEEFGSAWNARRQAPEAPVPGPDVGGYVAGWEQWCRAVVAQPELSR